jgi:hypothetical protein
MAATSMAQININEGLQTYCAKEAVGVFADPDSLERAVDQLELAGFDRAAISVLATDTKMKGRIGHLNQSAAEIADDPRVPRGAFASRDSRSEGEAVAVGVPFQIGGFAGAAAVVAAGGTLAAAIAGLILGGAVGGGIGALLALAVARNHSEAIREQLAQGGLVLWVRTPDDASEKCAVAILKKCCARSVHVHAIEREWGLSDRPIRETQFDPFLERDPDPA